ncbi:DUF6308 family protein [Streptomyces chryseus]|uniref:DUF6308 family protein n=1 Tax=Streptomyces chryseus TaxID=68186 RepID=UPI00227D928D|nr:DUF6308 family protein [Streptomyces chryseus]
MGNARRYFGIGLPLGVAAFTGSRFEHLAGGGGRPEVADTVTAEDLVAVQTLSVTVPAPVALDILEGAASARACPLCCTLFPATSTWLMSTRSSWPTARRRTRPGISFATRRTSAG